MQKRGDIAPALLISRQRRSSSSPKLETIVEEGSEKFGGVGVVVPKRVLFLLPVFVSLGSFLLMNRRSLMR